MFVDTHCHISSLDYEDIAAVFEENIENDVKYIINCACDKKSIPEALEMLDRYRGVFLTVGYHPSEASSYTQADIDYLEQIIINNKGIVGLGEIGLDYHYGKDNAKQQQDLFEKQLDLAEKLNIPVVIHTRDATADTIEILKRHNNYGVVHCFSGSVETANILIDMGYILGIGGVVTFKNSNLYKVIEAVGLNNIVLETDSPYLAPEPFRGKKNSSKYIPIIASKIADICKVDVSVVKEKTTLNACNLFDLK